MPARKRVPLPPGVLDIDAPQLSLRPPAADAVSDVDDAAIPVVASFADAAVAAGLTINERNVAWRWRLQGFRGAISTVKAHRRELALLLVIIEEVETAEPEVWVTWRNKGGLLNHMLREALGGADATAEVETAGRRRASAPRAGAARRKRRATG